MPGFGSIRTGLIALLIVAAVPLIGMAGIISWQNYRGAANQLVQRTLLVLHAAASRHDATIEGTALLLATVSHAPLIQQSVSDLGDASQCDDFLRQIETEQPGRYTNFAVLDGQGRLRCSAKPLVQRAQPSSQNAPGFDPERGESFANSDWFQRVAATHKFSVMAPDFGPFSHVARIVAVSPILGPNGAFRGLVYSALRLDWLISHAATPTFIFPGQSSGDHLWLIDDAGHPIEVAQSFAETLPARKDLSAFIDHLQPAQIVPAIDRDMYCYAAARIGTGLRLLVGYNVTAELAQARREFIARVVELGLVLMLGIGAVAIGANHAVQVPLGRLTGAVNRWRGGGPFEPPEVHLPSELMELATAFQQATAALAAHEMQLRGALTQQEALMQEIHHRVKNNMQIVASLLNLQAGRIRQPEARAEFQSARDRVRALATLHRHLYTHGELQTINMRSFLNELCAQLFQAFGETAGQRISLDIEAPELRISSDQAVPLSLIVTETVSNAIKYAFPGDRGGKIGVRLTQNGSGAKLVIEDDGIGLPEAGEGKAGGIGLQLIRGFSRQIGAKLTVERVHGMRYIIDMPLEQVRPVTAPFVPAEMDPAA